MDRTDLSVFLSQQLPLLPIWFALLGGLIAACVFWQECPRPALLTLLALLLLGVTTAVGPAVNIWLLHIRVAQHRTTTQLGYDFMVTGVILSLLRAVGYILLLVAIFVGRRPPPLPPAGTMYPPSPLAPRTL